MGRKPDRKKLGRGLSALLGDLPEAETQPAAGAPAASEGARSATDLLPIDLIYPNPDQPRRDFNETELEELAHSISQRGVIQPVIVRPDPVKEGTYQIVAGERRWRAAQRAKLHNLPVVVRQLEDEEVLELALIENIQRADLNPVEEALAYAQLIEKCSYTQEELAKILGKSRPHLANTMRLLALSETIQTMLREGKLTAGHARALINAPDPEALAIQVVSQGLTVRQTEALAQKLPKRDLTGLPRKGPQKDADTRQLEGDLSAAIGMRVSIDHGAAGGGVLQIKYKSLEDLDRLCAHLAG